MSFLDTIGRTWAGYNIGAHENYSHAAFCTTAPEDETAAGWDLARAFAQSLVVRESEFIISLLSFCPRRCLGIISPLIRFSHPAAVPEADRCQLARSHTQEQRPLRAPVSRRAPAGAARGPRLRRPAGLCLSLSLSLGCKPARTSLVVAALALALAHSDATGAQTVPPPSLGLLRLLLRSNIEQYQQALSPYEIIFPPALQVCSHFPHSFGPALHPLARRIINLAERARAARANQPNARRARVHRV